MKPCGKYRKLIALLGMDSLEVDDQRGLRDHLESCADCLRYYEETRSIAGLLRAADSHTEVQASTAFHRRVASAIAGTELRGAIETWLVDFWFRSNWRLALPAVAVVAVAIVVWLAAPKSVDRPDPTSVTATTDPHPRIKQPLAPTISNYESVAHQSLDKLDQLLTDQGGRNLEHFPAFTAGQLPQLNAAD